MLLLNGVEVDEHSGGWMTDDNSFWKRWNSGQTVFMLTEESTFEQPRTRFPGPCYVVARGLYDIVLSNRLR